MDGQLMIRTFVRVLHIVKATDMESEFFCWKGVHDVQQELIDYFHVQHCSAGYSAKRFYSEHLRPIK